MFIALRPPVLVDLVGIERVARIFGLMNIGDGLGNLAGLPLLGKNHKLMKASLVSSVGSMVAPLTGWYRVRILVGLALHHYITSSLCVQIMT